MNRKKLISLAVVGLIALHAAANQPENVRPITLDEAILIARTQSVDAAVALNELKTAYWEYRTYRADLLPEVNLSAVVPNYNKAYSSYQQEDGSYTFVRNNYTQMNGQLSIDQNIWLTGGTLSLNTSLDFLRQMDGDKTKRFMSVPVALTLNQPIFGVNNIKWNRRIEPVRYAEAKAAFLSATEEVTMTTINYFFNLLLAKENVGIAKQNLENAEKLYEVAKAKRKMGQISENDVLQLKLNMLNAQSALTNNESTLKSNMFQLRSFLALGENEELEPVLPETLPTMLLNYQDVLDKALANNSFAHNIRRRQLEADYQVAKAKGRLQVLCDQTDNGKALQGCVGIGHTRWAAHGAPSDINSHPHLSDSGKIAVVHNGIIEKETEIPPPPFPFLLSLNKVFKHFCIIGVYCIGTNFNRFN